MSFSVEQRKANLKRLSEETFDIAIIGGGITGAGAARDAASRGLKVALVEANDFASGTSSRSSKLIHGGIRYLENREFGLVFEALSERKILFEIAPHLVHPLKFVLPMYEGAKHGMFIMGVGMWLYDALSMYDAPEPHERLERDQALYRLPMLKENGLVGAYAYYDAYMDDDRLTIETHRSAFNMGAVAANWVKVNSAEFQSGKVTSLRCRDLISQSDFTIRAKHYVGTLGPWTDIFGESALGNWKKVLRPTKGIHLTFDRKRLPLKEAIVMVDDAKGRIVFGIPRHEMVIIGTTDTDFKGDPGLVHSDADDVKYVLEIASEYFPGANLTESDIIASYSGVRPLVHDGSSSEGKTSREHKIWLDERGITFVAGGKYTTYRHMAEQVVNSALENFSLEDRIRFQKSNTKLPLNERASPQALERAREKVIEWSERFGFSVDDVSFLVERHGLEVAELLEISLSEGLSSIWQIEAYYAIHHTMCLNLDDFYIRRAPLFLAQKDHGKSLVTEIAQVFSRYLGWTPSEIKAQIERIERHEATEMGWRKR